MVGHIKIQTTAKRYNCFKYFFKDGKVHFNERAVSTAALVSITDNSTGTILWQHPRRQPDPKQRTRVFHVSKIKETIKAGDYSVLLYPRDPTIKRRAAKKIADVIVI